MHRTILKIGFVSFLVPAGADVGPVVSLLSQSQMVTEDVNRGLVDDQWHYRGQGTAPRIEVVPVTAQQLHGVETGSVQDMITRRLVGRSVAIASSAV